MILFKNLEFQIENDVIKLTKCGNMEDLQSRIAEVQISGGHKDSHMGIKMVNSSEGMQLKYVSCKKDGNTLEIVQKSPRTQVKRVFTAYEDCEAIRVATTVTKIAGEPIDVLVNGKFVAKGEVVVIEESFGIRVTEIVK